MTIQGYSTLTQEINTDISEGLIYSGIGGIVNLSQLENIEQSEGVLTVTGNSNTIVYQDIVSEGTLKIEGTSTSIISNYSDSEGVAYYPVIKGTTNLTQINLTEIGGLADYKPSTGTVDSIQVGNLSLSNGNLLIDGDVGISNTDSSISNGLIIYPTITGYVEANQISESIVESKSLVEGLLESIQIYNSSISEGSVQDTRKGAAESRQNINDVIANGDIIIKGLSNLFNGQSSNSIGSLGIISNSNTSNYNETNVISNLNINSSISLNNNNSAISEGLVADSTSQFGNVRLINRNISVSDSRVSTNAIASNVQTNKSNVMGKVQKFVPNKSARGIQLGFRHGRNQVIRDLCTLKGKIQNNNSLNVELPSGKTLVSNNLQSLNLSTDSPVDISLSLGVDTLNISVSRQIIIDSFIESLTITNNGDSDASVRISASSPIIPKPVASLPPVTCNNNTLARIKIDVGYFNALDLAVQSGYTIDSTSKYDIYGYFGGEGTGLPSTGSYSLIEGNIDVSGLTVEALDAENLYYSGTPISSQVVEVIADLSYSGGILLLDKATLTSLESDPVDLGNNSSIFYYGDLTAGLTSAAIWVIDICGSQYPINSNIPDNPCSETLLRVKMNIGYSDNTTNFINDTTGIVATSDTYQHLWGCNLNQGSTSVLDSKDGFTYSATSLIAIITEQGKYTLNSEYVDFLATYSISGSIARTSGYRVIIDSIDLESLDFDPITVPLQNASGYSWNTTGNAPSVYNKSDWVLNICGNSWVIDPSDSTVPSVIDNSLARIIVTSTATSTRLGSGDGINTYYSQGTYSYESYSSLIHRDSTTGDASAVSFYYDAFNDRDALTLGYGFIEANNSQQYEPNVKLYVSCNFGPPTILDIQRDIYGRIVGDVYNTSYYGYYTRVFGYPVAANSNIYTFDFVGGMNEYTDHQSIGNLSFDISNTLNSYGYPITNIALNIERINFWNTFTPSYTQKINDTDSNKVIYCNFDLNFHYNYGQDPLSYEMEFTILNHVVRSHVPTPITAASGNNSTLEITILSDQMILPSTVDLAIANAEISPEIASTDSWSGTLEDITGYMDYLFTTTTTDQVYLCGGYGSVFTDPINKMPTSNSSLTLDKNGNQVGGSLTTPSLTPNYEFLGISFERLTGGLIAFNVFIRARKNVSISGAPNLYLNNTQIMSSPASLGYNTYIPVIQGNIDFLNSVMQSGEFTIEIR